LPSESCLTASKAEGRSIAPGIARYARHSRWTDPRRFAADLDPLPAEPAMLAEIVGGLVLHPFFVSPGSRNAEAALRSVPEMLAALLERDPRPLGQARPPENRVFGTCRNYALLACAILRQHGVPARLRVGFADYFTPGFSEDHWVCEYRDADDWRLLDAELTAEVRRRLAIAFDPADVPRDRFLVAAGAWRVLREGGADERRFGVSPLGLSGLWFAAGSLLRDLAALAMEEMMPWDYWGPARDFRPGAPVPAGWLAALDSLADVLTPAPANYDDAQQVVAGHPWAALTPTILSFPEGRPIEVALGRP
jgi:Transglutaminase-like superfamily